MTSKIPTAPANPDVMYASTVNNELVFDVDSISKTVVEKMVQKVTELEKETDKYKRRKIDETYRIEQENIKQISRKEIELKEKLQRKETELKEKLHKQTMRQNEETWKYKNRNTDMYMLERQNVEKDAESKRNAEKLRIKKISEAEAEQIREYTRKIRLDNNKKLYIFQSIGYGLIGSGVGIILFSSML